MSWSGLRLTSIPDALHLSRELPRLSPERKVRRCMRSSQELVGRRVDRLTGKCQRDAPAYRRSRLPVSVTWHGPGLLRGMLRLLGPLQALLDLIVEVEARFHADVVEMRLDPPVRGARTGVAQCAEEGERWRVLGGCADLVHKCIVSNHVKTLLRVAATREQAPGDQIVDQPDLPDG